MHICSQLAQNFEGYLNTEIKVVCVHLLAPCYKTTTSLLCVMFPWRPVYQCICVCDLYGSCACITISVHLCSTLMYWCTCGRCTCMWFNPLMYLYVRMCSCIYVHVQLYLCACAAVFMCVWHMYSCIYVCVWCVCSHIYVCVTYVQVYLCVCMVCVQPYLCVCDICTAVFMCVWCVCNCIYAHIAAIIGNGCI